MPIFINPLTDFGFKRIFANPKHTNITIAFINSILNLENPIVEIEFQNLENPAENYELRGVIYDILCKDNLGRQFIVELQRAKQEFFIDRSLFYVCRYLNSQLKKGKTDIPKERFKLLPIYFIGILDFELFNDKDFIRKVNLRDEKCNKIDETLNFTFVEIPKFNIENPQNDMEKMLYFLKNGRNIQKRIFRDSPFDDIFDLAEYYQLNEDEQRFYDTVLNQELAKIDAIETAFEDGKKERDLEIAKGMLKKALDKNLISELTGLSISEIEQISK